MLRQFKLCARVCVHTSRRRDGGAQGVRKKSPTTDSCITSQKSGIKRRRARRYNINSRVVFAYSFNNNYWHCITHMNQILLNLAKINWKPSLMWNWCYYSRFYCNIYICSWCVSVGMQIRYMPCGQLDWDDSFLQHIFIWYLCEVQLHYLNGLSFKYAQDEYITNYFILSLVIIAWLLADLFFPLLSVILYLFFWLIPSLIKWISLFSFY